MRIFQSILLAIGLFLTSTLFALTIPAKPNGYVSDYAHLLPPGNVATLTDKLKQFEQQTTNQIFVAIFPSLEQEEIADFTTRLEEQWKIGQKGKDNGVLLVIFVKEHQARIEVGYGLEGTLPDARAIQIIQEDIVPDFKIKKYYEGIDKTIAALMSTIENNNTAPAVVPAPDAQSEAMRKHFINIIVTFLYNFPRFIYPLLILVSMIGVFVSWNAPKENTPNLTSWQRKQIKIRKFSIKLLGIFMLIATFGRGGRSKDDDSSGGGGGRSGGGGASGKW